ncbi:acetate/propionate family kinase [Pseudosulfitobacter sp. DSM 107133]|uniref:acetate/propionate family kinase n=1 Tax=Pseudosulfitobacter sp. DSM 107133 TaxID=2883100 RepID=UPI000DF1ECC7|nr:acetate/propionate family kinase [Pseudosulfitobacter sp. DSM 107133]UOA27220.1 putative propionate kinase [Pseudosulfitobacter sp. DSM 107133]
MTDAILVLNAGSSSLKFAVYPAEAGDAILKGKVAGIGTDPVFSATDAQGLSLLLAGPRIPKNASDRDDLIPSLLAWLSAQRPDITFTAAGHRVVHGGLHQTGPARITHKLLADLKALVPLAPMHQPHSLAAIGCVALALPDLPQIACFDTAFHRTMPRLAQLFALPREMTDDGVLRYGFHGLSYDYISGCLPHHLGNKAKGRVIVAHLGSGASMCALKNHQSVATSMGFTALDGLMMGRRSGALDPGVVLYLMQEKGMCAADITTLLYEQSGLLGVSGISSDMKVLETSTAPEAEEAIDLFCARAAGELASLATSLGGLDAIVFTAGIGESSARVRSGICDRLGWMGVALDTSANTRNATRISAISSDIDVLVIPTDEEVVVAEATRTLTGKTP